MVQLLAIIGAFCAVSSFAATDDNPTSATFGGTIIDNSRIVIRHGGVVGVYEWATHSPDQLPPLSSLTVGSTVTISDCNFPALINDLQYSGKLPVSIRLSNDVDKEGRRIFDIERTTGTLKLGDGVGIARAVTGAPTGPIIRQEKITIDMLDLTKYPKN